MKLLRYGPAGKERPAILDNNGKIRDLSAQVSDIGGDALLPASLNKLRHLDINSLPLVEGNPRLGACIGSVGKFI
ncbi:MAG: ureidoglycolate lyase, partial [Ewingella sp.]